MTKGLERLNNKNLPCSNCKELKALEIIKENFKPYDIEELENNIVRVWIGHDHYVDLPREKYDLLKEVLLWMNN